MTTRFLCIIMVLAMGMISGMISSVCAQAVDLTIRRVAPTHGLEIRPDNYVFVEVANRALSNVTEQPVVNLEIRQGKKVKIMKGKAPALNAQNNFRSIVHFLIDVSVAHPDVQLKAVVNPGRRIGETNHRNNSLQRSYSVQQEDWVGPGGKRIIAIAFMNGTWGYNGAGTYKEIEDVKIRLYQGSNKISEGWTDEKGKKYFNDVPAGTYTIKASRNGYYLKQATFNLGSADKTIKLAMSPGG
ncbi:MAG: prealbumin-like fold domain-containing protein [Saprospiraceae bacterium]|nr:prealbumin-like fold domain-containing protein [Saprospiraceae bacterium]